ncbi:MAG: Uma2 family endonuclease [Bacteroidia bacterium]|nr:Uma2 family endonuclease [Bacteroidia bacterium]
MSYPSVPYELSWEAYLELEAQSEERYEYHDGEIVAMSGATNRHNQMIGNAYIALRAGLDAQGCGVFSETVKLFRHRSDRYLYPDLTATCHPFDLQTRNGVRSPFLILEVLSKTNTHRQMRFKQREYFKLPSLRHYLLAEQEAMSVHHYCRQDGGLWDIRFFESPDDCIELPELGISLRLGDLYAGITLDPEVSEAEEAAALYGE